MAGVQWMLGHCGRQVLRSGAWSKRVLREEQTQIVSNQIAAEYINLSSMVEINLRLVDSKILVPSSPVMQLSIVRIGVIAGVPY